MSEPINIIGQGVNDPHIHVYDGRAYLYASHDYSPDNTKFDMRDWQVWSSDDLLNWRHESTLRPEDTYIGAPMHGCWATDAVEHRGRYYWAFSDMKSSPRGAQIGMVVSDRPGGPWRDELGAPLLKPDCAPTTVYDPCFFKEDDGSIHILFGVWQYFIAPMSDDMTHITAPLRSSTRTAHTVRAKPMTKSPCTNATTGTTCHGAVTTPPAHRCMAPTNIAAASWTRRKS